MHSLVNGSSLVNKDNHLQLNANFFPVLLPFLEILQPFPGDSNERP